MRKIVIKMKNLQILVALRDIFDQKGFKVIDFGEYFELIYEDSIISDKTLTALTIPRAMYFVVAGRMTSSEPHLFGGASFVALSGMTVKFISSGARNTPFVSLTTRSMP
jgi:hypothetical protein